MNAQLMFLSGFRKQLEQSRIAALLPEDNSSDSVLLSFNDLHSEPRFSPNQTILNTPLLPYHAGWHGSDRQILPEDGPSFKHQMEEPAGLFPEGKKHKSGSFAIETMNRSQLLKSRGAPQAREQALVHARP